MGITKLTALDFWIDRHFIELICMFHLNYMQNVLQFMDGIYGIGILVVVFIKTSNIYVCIIYVL